MNRNYQKVDKKILRVLKCKKIVGLQDFLYKVCGIRLLKVCCHRYLEFGNYFFNQLEPTFLAKLLCLQRTTAYPLTRNKSLLSNGASLVGKARFSLKHGNMWHTFQESETKIMK